MENNHYQLRRSFLTKREKFENEMAQISLLDSVYMTWDRPHGLIFTFLTEFNHKYLPESLISQIEKTLYEVQNYNFRVYSVEYAQKELEKGNIYFIRNCSLGSLVYKSTSSMADQIFIKHNARYLIHVGELAFRKEMMKINNFRKGIYFYKKAKLWPQTTFLIHQTLEMLFRCMENYVMGKPLICHKIKTHLEYFYSYYMGAKRLFNDNSRTEQEILELLDRAYSESRYHSDFDISGNKVLALLSKIKVLEQQVNQSFQFGLEDCKKSLRGYSAEKLNCRESQYVLED